MALGTGANRDDETSSTSVPEGWRSDDDNNPDLYDWKSVSTDRLVVEYLSGYERTATHTLTALEWVADYVDTNFPHSLSGDAVVNLCPSQEIMAMEFGGRRNPVALVGSSGGRILMLHPQYSGPCGSHYTELPEPRQSPFVQTLIHEYSHVPFYNKLYDASGYSDPPRWLSQGIGDYLARNYRPNYIVAVDEAVSNETWDFEQRPYYWGLFLAEYMYKSYSPEGIAGLLESDAESFDEAMQATFGVSYSRFQEVAKSYLRDRFSEPVDPSEQSELGACAPGSDTGDLPLTFDLNGDGEVTIHDVQALFAELTD